MIEHIYINNYKAFEKENIPLEEHGLIIGTNNSGKTTLLEALDLFFNHRLRFDYIRDQSKDVKIECSINEKRYRKVFSPPDYRLNKQTSIGDFFDLREFVYLFLPKSFDKNYLVNELLRVNTALVLDEIIEPSLKKAYQVLTGITNHNDTIFSRISLSVDAENQDNDLDSKLCTQMLKGIHHPNVIIGIDHVEAHIEQTLFSELPRIFKQSILTTKTDHVIEAYPYHVQAFYKEDVKKEADTTLRVSHNQYDKVMLLVEGKYDVAWFEKGLKLLDKYQEYRVIPCGGFGNIPHVEQQLKKAGFKTLVVTDGDVRNKTSLSRDVIELYADVAYVNYKFHTQFKEMPRSKSQLFKAIHTKDDVVKKVLSSWAKYHLRKNSAFVQELDTILS